MRPRTIFSLESTICDAFRKGTLIPTDSSNFKATETLSSFVICVAGF